MALVSLAITISSSVAMSSTLIAESGVESVPVTPHSLLVKFLIQLNAKTFKIVANLFTEHRLVFTDTCREYDAVTTAERYIIAADVLCNLVVKHFVGKVSFLILPSARLHKHHGRQTKRPKCPKDPIPC